MFAKTTFYRGLQSAVGEGFTISEGGFYKSTGKTHRTIAAFVAGGVLDELSGDPGPGFEPVELTADALSATTRPAPTTEQPIDARELCNRLDWSIEDLKAAHLLGFPKSTMRRGGALTTANPHNLDTAMFMWSQVAKWLREAQPTAEKIVSAAASAAR